MAWVRSLGWPWRTEEKLAAAGGLDDPRLTTLNRCTKQLKRPGRGVIPVLRPANLNFTPHS